jgi:hypothetical protein
MPYFSPVSTGGGEIPKGAITSTTGSPTVDTSSRSGKTIYKFTGSGSITVGTGGTFEVLLVGGGGAGGYTYCQYDGARSGGGGGGVVYNPAQYIAAGTYTVTVGVGGVGSNINVAPHAGGASAIMKSGNSGDSITALGGGSAAHKNQIGQYTTANIYGGENGGSGGGSATDYYGFGNAGTNLVSGQGNPGGLATYVNGQYCGISSGGGGGGAGSAGGNGTRWSSRGPNGGDGLAYSITGTSTYYGGGGGAQGMRQQWYCNNNCNSGLYNSPNGFGGAGGGGNSGGFTNVNGYQTVNGNSGTCGLGGGGGAFRGNGGSGVVIVVVG